MRYELFVGLRYLRARRREAFVSLITMISIIGVTISVITLDVALSVMTGFENDLRDRILGFSPHVVVTSYTGAVEKPDEITATIAGVPGVVAAAPFIYVQAMIARESAVSGVFVRGVDPARANDVVDIGDYLLEGSFTAMAVQHEVSIPGEDGAEDRTVRLPGIVIGAELARRLGVGHGGVLSVFSPLGSASPVGMIPRIRRFVVVGLFDSGMYEFDGGLIYMSIRDAQKLFDFGKGVSGVEVRTKNLDHADRIAAAIEREVLGFPFEARDWMSMNRNVFVALKLEKVVYFLVLSLMLVVAAFSILATLIMVVMEKRKDIAILKSMGATDASIARIFVLKGVVIGVIGIVAGNVLGLALTWLISKYPLPLPKNVFYAPTVPVEIVPAYFAAVSAAAFVICFLVTIYPAMRAARVAPVDVIRHE